MKRLLSLFVLFVVLFSSSVVLSEEKEMWPCINCEHMSSGYRCEVCKKEKGIWVCNACHVVYSPADEKCGICGKKKTEAIMDTAQELWENEEYERAYFYLLYAAEEGDYDAMKMFASLYYDDLLPCYHIKTAIRDLDTVYNLIANLDPSVKTDSIVTLKILSKKNKLGSEAATNQYHYNDQQNNTDASSGKETQNTNEKTRVRCSRCNGKGHTNCTACDGTGWEKCTICRGSGRKSCYNCDGTGKVKKYYSGGGLNGIGSGSWEWERCSSCHGNGYKDCTSCSGRGKTKCGRCYGKGYQECVYCNGTGYEYK